MIDIGTCFNYGIEQIKKNPSFYILSALIIFIISGIFGGIAVAISMVVIGVMAKIGLPGIVIMIVGPAMYVFFVVLSTVLTIVLMIGFWKGIIKEYEGKTAEVADIFSAFDSFVPGILNYGVAGLMFAIGHMMCYLPGLLVAPLMPMTIFFIAKGDKEGFSPLKKSIDLLMKNPLLIIFCLIFNIIASLGLLACGVGILVTAPFSLCAMHKMFQQALGQDNPVPTPVQQN